MLTAADPIRSHGGLKLPTPVATDALRTAVAAAAQSEIVLGRRGLAIPLRRRDGTACVAHVLPLRHHAIREGLSQRATAAVFIAAAASPQLPADALTLLYDLTPAEARVFELIAAGHTIANIATTLGIAASTVKTHLLRVFDKTGCNRQAALVKLAASMTPPL
jgi:DNA-binding CsgD family transcriptional regulator